jgi:hypothetical protein
MSLFTFILPETSMSVIEILARPGYCWPLTDRDEELSRCSACAFISTKWDFGTLIPMFTICITFLNV